VTKRQNLHLSAKRAAGPDESAAHEPDDLRVEYANLVRAAVSGDESAMERLLVRAQEVAFRVSLLVCGQQEDAEDVMQEALLKTYRFVNRIHDPNAFRTWLYRTVRNACLMKRRRRVDEPARHVSIDTDDRDADSAPRPLEVRDQSRAADERLLDAWTGERLRRALRRLPRPYRAIVVLREIEGLSTKEVASIARISEANVKTRLHRARALLRQELGDL
jgi:RNA polymerase sigma-70 factor (ECF subfamily)